MRIVHDKDEKDWLFFGFICAIAVDKYFPCFSLNSIFSYSFYKRRHCYRNRLVRPYILIHLKLHRYQKASKSQDDMRDYPQPYWRENKYIFTRCRIAPPVSLQTMPRSGPSYLHYRQPMWGTGKWWTRLFRNNKSANKLTSHPKLKNNYLFWSSAVHTRTEWKYRCCCRSKHLWRFVRTQLCQNCTCRNISCKLMH